MNDAHKSLADKVDAIESAYEFMLAYAAQGRTTDAGAPDGQNIRRFLAQLRDGLRTLPEACRVLVPEDGGPYRKFLNVLERDAADALAAVELVAAQPAIGSQLIDNLNAAIHLRALLTDLFLIDEVLKKSGG